ncbi:MAG TPA: AAA family ATPase [Pirellulales bacterium]|nr:AAA family ATPase [Pirellulales bacterium]
MLVCLADVEPREVAWLWPDRVPLGRLTLLVGRPGEGKSFLTTDMAARITTGTPWPDGSECPRGSVILISAEDDPGDTIRPRLDAHFADVGKVHLLSAVRSGEGERMVTMADVRAIEAAIKRVPDCRLIVVDPIGSFLGGRTDAHRDNEVRGVLAPIAKLAESYGVAVVVVAHRRKSAGSIADDTALGSRAFTGIARAVWHVSRESKTRRLLLPGKNNLAPAGHGLAFSIIGKPGRIVWEPDPVKMSADDALAAEADQQRRKPGPDADERNEVTAWLREALADGPRPASDMQGEARAHGYSAATVKRARKAVGVKAHHETVPGPWYWRLPGSKMLNASKGEQPEHLEPLAENAEETAGFGPPESQGAQVVDIEHLGPTGCARVDDSGQPGRREVA